MKTTNSKKFVTGFIAVLIAVSLSSIPVAARPQTSVAVTFDLCASTGSVTMPDSTVVPIWGFSLDTGSGCPAAQLPGPVLDVNAGDVVTINLTNVDVPQSVALEIPGQAVTGSYTFTASDPGTYLYESSDGRGVLMGLYGALIVRPATAGQAYNSVDTAFDTEASLVLSEIDPAFNASPTTFNTVNYAPKYWLINGLAYPQTVDISADAGDRVLLRYVNAGSLHHTMSLIGTHQLVIGKDGYPVSFPFQVVGETIPAGSTLDTIATIPASASTGTRYPLYNRQLHLTNGLTFPGGMLTFIEVGAGCVNQSAAVGAGSDQTITLPASATLDGTLTDDGCVAVTTTWTQQSGPGTATFGNANAVDTAVSFSVAGTYILRLTAVDGAFTVFDEVQITVNPIADLIFTDGFETGNFSAWSAETDTEGDLNVTAAAGLVGSQGMAALIDNTTAMYVQDNTPVNESRYRARFYFDPNSITMANNNAHFIMVARNATLEVARVEFRRNSGNYQIRASIRNDGGGFTNTSWFTISDAPHSIEIDWKASTGPGANNGYLSLWIDNSNSASPTATVSGIDNDTRQVEAVRLGPLASIDSGTSGTEFFDGFVSRETTFIGP